MVSAAVPALVVVALNAGRVSSAVVEASVSWLWPSVTTVDVTDLWVLPAALVGWRLLSDPRHRRAPAGAMARPDPRVRRPHTVATWLLIGLAVTATTATSCDGPAGVQAIVEDDGTLHAQVDSFSSWSSTDGGRTWERDRGWPFEEFIRPQSACLEAGVCYQASGMDLTLDGEVVWALPASRAEVLRRAWERRQDCGDSHLRVGDPVLVAGDQVIVPRGVDGLLVGSPSEGFERIGLYPYRPAAGRGVSPALLDAELFYATMAGVLVVLLPFLLWTAVGLRHDVATAIAVVLVVMAAASGPALIARWMRAHADDE